MLGVLSAVNAALRPLGAGTAGIETVFFVLVLAGRVYGPGFGFTLGCTSLFASALITGGVGPWMPYQMFGCAFVGMLAGLLPRATGRREVVMLAVYGSLSGYLFGFLLNLSFWPFSLDPNSSIAYLPGLPFTEQWRRYLAFDVATSLGWDTGRAVTNFVCVMLAGPLSSPRSAGPRARRASGAGAVRRAGAGDDDAHRTAWRRWFPYDMTALDSSSPPEWLQHRLRCDKPTIAASREPRAASREPRAASREPRAASHASRRAASREPRAASRAGERDCAP